MRTGRYSYLGGGIPLPASHALAERRAYARAAQFAAEAADAETVAARLLAMGPPPGWSDLVTWRVKAWKIAAKVVSRQARRAA